MKSAAAKEARAIYIGRSTICVTGRGNYFTLIRHKKQENQPKSPFLTRRAASSQDKTLPAPGAYEKYTIVVHAPQKSDIN